LSGTFSSSQLTSIEAKFYHALLFLSSCRASVRRGYLPNFGVGARSVIAPAADASFHYTERHIAVAAPKLQTKQLAA
jgi:hypothetical protein